MMLQFKVDENLPKEAADLLAEAGYDALAVLEQELGGESDDTIASVCQRERRVIVTLDLDFADIRHYPPADYAGIICLRLLRQDKQHVVDVLTELIPAFLSEDLAGKLWIVDESSIRIRG